MFKSLATEITHTCHESYIRTATRIGPESFSFKNGMEAEPIDGYYILRPEVSVNSNPFWDIFCEILTLVK